MTAATRPAAVASERETWRAVAVPSEHGGWGLTLEPVLLGLLVAPSIGGAALALAAFVAFLIRTPLKLVAIDLRHHRWLDRSRLASRIAGAELVALIAAVAVAVAAADPTWIWPVVVAAPLVAVEVAYDVRSRSRRLVPELCGATGIAAVSAAIPLAAAGDGGLAAGLWLVLAARAIGAIPFVRVQIFRLRRGTAMVWHSDLAQSIAVIVGAIAAIVEPALTAGALGVCALAVAQTVWVRRPTVAAKQLGMRQMAMGLALVIVTAAGVAL